MGGGIEGYGEEIQSGRHGGKFQSTAQDGMGGKRMGGPVGNLRGGNRGAGMSSLDDLKRKK